MSALDILKLILGGQLPGTLPKIKLDHWIVSHNGVRKGPVSVGKVGLKSVDVFWTHLEFAEDGTTHILDAERPLMGGAATILLDGKLVVGGHLGLRKHLTGFPPSLRVEIDVSWLTDTYRFDVTAH